uniref:PRANC domain-containing protein n=1 Tax=Trichogramma kaykai TaxID=54128 RepID=A0ABD2VV80_9HYME
MPGENFDISHDNKKKVEKLKSLRDKVNWKIEKERVEFLRQLDPLISDWKSQLPDLRGIFRPEEIESLLSDCIKNQNQRDFNFYLPFSFINFVAQTGYKDEPYVVKDGKPLLHRTTPLHDAAKCGNSIIWDIKVHELFKIYDKFDVNYTDEFGLTHFHVACMSGFINLVGKFLELGQDPNCISQESKANEVDPPLHLALKYGHEEMAELLLRSGADPNLTNDEGLTPLHIICIGNDDDYDNGEMAVMFFNIIDEIQLSVQVDAQDKAGNTPLHLALAKGCKKLVELLLGRGASPNLTDKDGLTPLHFTCMRNDDSDLVKMLFELSTDKHHPMQIDVVDKELGRTPLHYALANGWKSQIVRVLLTSGANPNSADKKGLTPLHIICRENRRNDLMKMLFELSNDKYQPVQVDALDNSCNTPLYYALSCGHRDLVEFLLRNDADPNLANKKGWTPLHIICNRDQYKNDDLIELFFKVNDEKHQLVQVNARNTLGQTPLQLAVANILPHEVDVLLAHGADLSSFVFRTESYFAEELEVQYDDISLDLKLRLTSGALAIVKSLEKRGYELYRSDAVMIMKLFVKYGLFENSEDLREFWYDDVDFTNIAKKIIISPNFSLHDLMQLQPEEAAKILTYTDYFELARSRKLWKLQGRYSEPCAMHLCEKLSRRFFRQWALEPFLELTRCRFPILCCDSILMQLRNQDLMNVCLAATENLSS